MPEEREDLGTRSGSSTQKLSSTGTRGHTTGFYPQSPGHASGVYPHIETLQQHCSMTNSMLPNAQLVYGHTERARHSSLLAPVRKQAHANVIDMIARMSRECDQHASCQPLVCAPTKEYSNLLLNCCQVFRKFFLSFSLTRTFRASTKNKKQNKTKQTNKKKNR